MFYGIHPNRKVKAGTQCAHLTVTKVQCDKKTILTVFHQVVLLVTESGMSNMFDTPCRVSGRCVMTEVDHGNMPLSRPNCDQFFWTENEEAS